MNPMATPDWQGIVTGRKEVDFFGNSDTPSSKVFFSPPQGVQDWLCVYGSIPIDIYQLFWGSLGTRVLTHPHVNKFFCGLTFADL